MTKTKCTMVLILVMAAQLVFSTVCWASETTDSVFTDSLITDSTVNGSTINGVIWLDENANGIFELSEETVPNAIVNIRRQNDDFIQSSIVGADGYFEIRNLPHGLYNVWAEVNGSQSETVIIEINEVSPVTVIDIAFAPEAAALSHQIWLPFAAH